jgi:hypothetical protein
MMQTTLPTIMQGSRIVLSRQRAYSPVPGLERDSLGADEKITVSAPLKSLAILTLTCVFDKKYRFSTAADTPAVPFL